MGHDTGGGTGCETGRETGGLEDGGVKRGASRMPRVQYGSRREWEAADSAVPGEHGGIRVPRGWTGGQGA
jgi:hypothetical protein